jgi:transposase InsO family protein
VGLSRSSYHYEAQPSVRDPLEDLIPQLALKYARWGYRPITALVRRLGCRINHKRVYRIWVEQTLQLPRKKPRKRRLWILNDRPHPATKPNEVWSLDFMFDRTLTGGRLKFLTLVDEYSRVSPLIRVGSRFTSEDVRVALQQAILEYGKPRYLRSDNGPEFICLELRRWLLAEGIQPVYIEPGHPWENGFIESFNGKFRKECLDGELFWSVEEAQFVAEKYRRLYNEVRPHMSLGYRTPAEVGRRPADPTAGLN